LKTHAKKIILSILAAMLIALWSCSDENSLSPRQNNISFSSDTIVFDTIFTSIGSITKSFRIINPSNNPIQITGIELAGGSYSPYKLNIDGQMSNSAYDVEIPAHDSIYIFVELTVDPNGKNHPMIIQDSVIILSNTQIYDIDLLAWGQDFVPIKNQIIGDTHWTAEKPYLIYDIAIVDSGKILTIDPGTEIYCNNNALLASVGTIIAKGTPDKPILFKTNMRENMYKHLPDQWHGILLFPNNSLNIFENVIIENAHTALQVGTFEYKGTTNAKLHNVRIAHNAHTGIMALNANIEASNVLIYDCHMHAVALMAGGDYNFTHCTIANYQHALRKNSIPAVLISNTISNSSKNKKFSNDLNRASWSNSIIWGNQKNELLLEFDEEIQSNFEFTNCFIKTNDSVIVEYKKQFDNTYFTIDPQFFDISQYNFKLDSLSPLINAGSKKHAQDIAFDLSNTYRLADSAPDPGVFEFISKKNNNDE
jgi:hypothetical protein